MKLLKYFPFDLPSVSGLELSNGREPVLALHLVLGPVEPSHLVVEDPGEVVGDGGGARGEGVGQLEAASLLVLVQAHLRANLPCPGPDAAGLDLQVGGVAEHLGDGLQHVGLHHNLPREGELGQVGLELYNIMTWHYIGRQTGERLRHLEPDLSFESGRKIFTCNNRPRTDIFSSLIINSQKNSNCLMCFEEDARY